MSVDDSIAKSDGKDDKDSMTESLLKCKTNVLVLNMDCVMPYSTICPRNLEKSEK